MLGRHAAAVGMVEEDQDPPAQQKRWPRGKTFERLAMLEFVTAIVVLDLWKSLSELSD